MSAAAPGTDWVFGYGSLIYKVDFPYLRREAACIRGWSRRFWQGSHDHRGTPGAPGRVVTLIPSDGETCGGMAYLVEHSVFEHLDHREKNGYQRHSLPLHLQLSKATVEGVVYVAKQDNHAFLGPAELGVIAAQIGASTGPSGRNTDYVLELAQALRQLHQHDPHVFALEALLVAQ